MHALSQPVQVLSQPIKVPSQPAVQLPAEQNKTPFGSFTTGESAFGAWSGTAVQQQDNTPLDVAPLAGADTAADSLLELARTMSAGALGGGEPPALCALLLLPLLCMCCLCAAGCSAAAASLRHPAPPPLLSATTAANSMPGEPRATSIEEEHLLTGHSRAVLALALHEPSCRLYSSSTDATVRAWDTSDMTCLAVIRGHSKPVTHLQLLGSRLLFTAAGGGVRVWDTKRFVCVAKIRTSSYAGAIRSLLVR